MFHFYISYMLRISTNDANFPDIFPNEYLQHSYTSNGRLFPRTERLLLRKQKTSFEEHSIVNT